MEITKATCFPVNAGGKVKANGTVTISNAIDLKYTIMQGPKDIFISWNGGKAYKKKDGTNGWDSPIYISDEALNRKINETVMTKYKSVSSKGSDAPKASSNSFDNDSSFAVDDIPF